MRSEYCGLVTKRHLGATVTLCGWVHRRRDHAEADQPADHVWAVQRHLRHQLGFAAEMTGAQRILEVELRTVFGADGSLDAAFRHETDRSAGERDATTI